MVSYGKRLAKLRGNKTQAEVANAVGIAVSTLTMYELEQRVPRDSIKIALANYFGTTVQEIFFAEDCHEKGQKEALPTLWWIVLNQSSFYCSQNILKRSPVVFDNAFTPMCHVVKICFRGFDFSSR